MHRFLHWLVAYIAVGLSAGLAAWSGATGSDATLADAGIKGAIMFVLAGALWLIWMGWIIHLWSILDAAWFKPGTST